MTEALGRYIYCIIPDTGKKHWGEIGLDGQAVYTIPYKDISAWSTIAPWSHTREMTRRSRNGFGPTARR